MSRKVFFSFHYQEDNWRAAQVRNMGILDDTSKIIDNSWEEVRQKNDDNIKKWIDSQMDMCSCIVVLIGKNTADRKWIKYEIKRAYELKKGMVGIYINRLRDVKGNITFKGNNPFDYVYDDNGDRLSKNVKVYESFNIESQKVYNDIKENILKLVEDAINNRDNF